MNKVLIIKLGGSLVSDSDQKPFDFSYLEDLSSIVQEYVRQNWGFAISVGGGYMMRKLKDMAKVAGVKDEKQLHWIGTTYNNVNAEIVRAYMYEICNSRIVAYEDYYEEGRIKFEKGKSVIVGGGGRAGHSGDMDALIMAEELGADTIISLKNIDGVYTSDPRKDPSAARLDRISWEEYFKIIGWKTTHEPGGNYPIDPITAYDAEKQGKEFVIINGEDLENFKKVLEGQEFIGTIVK